MYRPGRALNRRERTAAQPRRDDGPLPLLPANDLQRPHICFVAPTTWPVFSHDQDNELIGGAEVQQSILARALVRDGYRVSMICLDFGQPQRVLLDGVMVHKAYRPDAGLRVLRFVHPRITTLWRAMRAVDADVYYQRCSAMLTALVAVYCRSHGKRSIFASACDLDFVPGRQPIRYLRDRWLYERAWLSSTELSCKTKRSSETATPITAVNPRNSQLLRITCRRVAGLGRLRAVGRKHA